MEKFKFILFICAFLCLFEVTYSATNLTTNDAAIVVSDNNTALLGYSVSYLGNITPGLSNFYAISAPFDGSSGTFDSGKLYLFEESMLSANIEASQANIIISGSTRDEEMGMFIAAGGDLDKDGLNDFVVLNPNLSSNQISIYLGKYYNNWTNTTIVKISEPNLGLEQTTNRYLASQTASISGDLNGDGYDDLVIGLTRNTDSTNPSGKVVIIYGSRDIESISSNLITAANHIVSGQSANDGFGYSVSILNDINQDGYDELLVGAFDESSEQGNFVGLQYGAFTSIFPVSGNETTLYTYADMDALFFSDTSGTDGFGQFVQGLGDINHDGFGDFAISAPKSGVNNGNVLIYNGSSTKFSGSYLDNTPVSATLALSNSYFLGLQSIQGKYDLTGDGIHNIVIGQPLSNTDSGTVYILNSSKLYSGEIDITTSIDYQIDNISDTGKLGYALTAGGDYNRDGIHDLLLGTNGLESNDGRAFFYRLNSTSTANATSVTFYSDSNYSTEITSAKINEIVYVEVVGNDPDVSQVNTIELTIQSGSGTENLNFYGVESGINSGRYRAEIMLVGTRTDSVLNQLFCSKSDTVTVFPSFFSSITDSLIVSNSAPEISNVFIEQVGSTDNTKINVNYSILDLNNDSVSFFTASNVQYSSDAGVTWQNATIDTTNSIVAAKNQVQIFSSDDTPLILTNFANYNGSLKVRIRGNDGTDLSSYVESSEINVDNLAPSQPTLFTINPKYSYNIIVTGNAEALSTVSIYHDDTLIDSVQADALGEYIFSSLTVNSTIDSIYAIATDVFNFTSPSSNVLNLIYSDRETKFENNTFIVTSNIALTSTENEQLINTSYLDSGSLPATISSIYNYVDAFSFTAPNLTFNQFDIPVTFNINFSSELPSKNGLSVFLYNPTTSMWETNENTIISSSTSTLTFKSKYLGQYLIAQLNDYQTPVISDVKINGYAIYDNQYYGNTFNLTATFSDLDSTISSYNIVIISDTTNSVVSSFSETYTQDNSQNEIDITVSPTNLSSDTYTIRLQVEDYFTNLKTVSHYIKVNTSELNFSILAGPNPVNLNDTALVFGYDISQDVDSLSIFIFDQRGTTVFEHEIQNVSAGYSTYSWNGLNKYSQQLTNGIYYAYCYVKKGETVKKKRLKIAILK